MHFEIFTEDRSGARLVEAVLPRLLGPNGTEHSWRLVPFSGIGRIPTGLRHTGSPRSRSILNKLPGIIQAYGKMETPDQRVVVLVDNDTRDCRAFKREIMAVIGACEERPRALVRIAVQETESWLLGDADAVLEAYPRANAKRLRAFKGDAVQGNWEYLADTIRAGDAKRLADRGYPELGAIKYEWAERIGPALDPARNRSESFNAFVDGIRKTISA
jgi:hypothetical protein